MQKITLLSVGSIKTPWTTAGCADYQERLLRSLQFEVIEVSASKQKDSKKQAQEESQSLLHRLEKMDGTVWVLDERGKEITSQQFAKEISTFADRGLPMIFILGGAYGLSDAIRLRADRVFALSQMTLPHELCRLVFLEQLYRATEIRRGSGYHH